MSYKIIDDHDIEVEVREIATNEYFEYQGSVYQRFDVSSNFNLKTSHYEPYPIFAVCLTSGLITYFSSDGKSKVIRLYETSPVALTRRKP